ncbi:glycosyltransferase family 4 protein [Spirochaeta isovalerica]|uniref:Glycosyltransferase n=1 Tax=Spirochaeta isovalerica TaxID=150 RepID=A0A841R1J7_9SPIO|nr:glycosyltransferase family 4 protein [Spirochaeta isovalerica]MBB6478864.1 hypothetical protein [Spirochaeta isovalerica]
MKNTYRIAFISGKLADVDGVSLEVDKWIEILSGKGHEIFTIAGKYGAELENVPPSNRYCHPMLAFDSPQQKSYEKIVFPYLSGKHNHVSQIQVDTAVSKMLEEGEELAGYLYDYIQEKHIDVLIAQNTNAMPMALLTGIAVHKLATERKVATIFHHHDFWWERSRFSGNRIEPLLKEMMPSHDLGLEHVVISSYAGHILKSIKRVNPHVVPNCEDFSAAPVRDEYNSTFRGELGYAADDILFIQPTRIVPRKRIEDSVRLVAGFMNHYPELKEKVRFIISLYQGDELDDSYVKDIQRLAGELDVPLDLIAHRVASVRGLNDKGEKLYTNRDVLVNADIVTYLPVWEGFGNAFLEAVAARVPVVISTYLVYKTDIQCAGFSNIEIRDSYDEEGNLILDDKVYSRIHRILTDEKARREMVEKNFITGKREFGFRTLEKKLDEILESYSDEIKASRRRLEKSRLTFSV